MASHTQLPIYKVAYDLLDVATDLVKNMPRDFKQSIGGKINSECVEIVVLIFRANCAQDKAPHLLELVERLQVAELLIRLAKDKRLISQGAYAKAVELSTSIGKQANGWVLTSAVYEAYLCHVLKKTGHGLGRPDSTGAMSRANRCRGFFAFARHGLYGRAGREGASPAGSCTRSTNPLGSVHPLGRGCSVLHPRTGATAMAKQPMGATALEHPSRFTANEVRLINRAITLIEEKRLRNAPVMRCQDDFARYLVLRFAGLTNEQGHVLYLNSNLELLAAEAEFFGDQSSVTFDFRRIALRAIMLGAESVVFAHNHPSDNPTPSEADIRHLKYSEEALRPLNITLLDSFVVTTTGITSIKEHNRFVEKEALRQRIADQDRRSAERRAKTAATKAAKRATLNLGVAA